MPAFQLLQEQQGGWLSTAFKAVGLGGDHHKPGHTDKDPQQVDSWTRAAEHGTDSGPTGYSHQRDAAPAHEDDSVSLFCVVFLFTVCFSAGLVQA